MIILAFDSTAKSASVALCDGDRLLGNYNIDNGLTHSELLLPMAENLLKTLKIGFDDVELFACTSGPGSFTGVRIGTAIVKGLAFSKKRPCIGVSTLEALAESLSSLKGVIVPVMDARRAQVYSAVFTSDGHEYRRVCDDGAISISELAQTLSKYDGIPIYLVGDGYKTAYNALTRLGVRLCETPPLLINQNAYSCALVAKRKYESGDYTTDALLSPTYLRMPQAERERLEREKQKQENI